MSERAPYSRIYWSVMDDPKFDGVREDARLFGSWALLLIAADMAHPSPAYVLPTVSRSALATLVEKGLVDLLDGHRYRIHGLDSERERRRIAATTRGPDGTRTVPGREANGQQAKQSRGRDETEQSKAPRAIDWDDGRVDLEAFLLLTRRVPTSRQRQLLDGLLDRHDLTGPQWAADIMMRHPDDPIGAVIEADREYRAERIAAAQTAEKPKPIPRRKGGLPQSARDILAEMQRLDAEKAATA